MLVLTRKSEESVMLGNSIEVKILSVRGDQVSLGFVAPHTVSIYRKEVYDAIQKENMQAVHRGGESRMMSLIDALGSQILKRPKNENKERGDAKAMTEKIS